MSAAADVFVSVVAPLHDDGDVLDAFVRETVSVLRAEYANYELVLVDDGSSDGTPDAVERLLREHACVRYIRLARRFGTEVAIAAGLDSVIGDYTVVMQPATDPPELVPELVHRARDRGVAFGVRNARAGEPAWAAVGSRLFWAAGRRLHGIPIPPGATFFQCLSRSAVNELTRIRDRYRSIRLLASRTAPDVAALPYEPLRRRADVRHRGLLESVDLAVGVVVSQSTRPLRFFAALGVFASLLNLVYMLYVIVIYLTRAHVQEGWTTTSLQVSGMFFLLFLCLAVISEYLGRVLEESRDRPLYHALEERNSNVMIRDAERRNVARDSA